MQTEKPTFAHHIIRPYRTMYLYLTHLIRCRDSLQPSITLHDFHSSTSLTGVPLSLFVCSLNTSALPVLLLDWVVCPDVFCIVRMTPWYFVEIYSVAASRQGEEKPCHTILHVPRDYLRYVVLWSAYSRGTSVQLRGNFVLPRIFRADCVGMVRQFN